MKQGALFGRGWPKRPAEAAPAVADAPGAFAVFRSVTYDPPLRCWNAVLASGIWGQLWRDGVFIAGGKVADGDGRAVR